MTPEEKDKLPKWAQLKVIQMENEIKELKNLLIAAEGKNAGRQRDKRETLTTNTGENNVDK